MSADGRAVHTLGGRGRADSESGQGGLIYVMSGKMPRLNRYEVWYTNKDGEVKSSRPFATSKKECLKACEKRGWVVRICIKLG